MTASRANPSGTISPTFTTGRRGEPHVFTIPTETPARVAPRDRGGRGAPGAGAVAYRVGAARGRRAGKRPARWTTAELRRSRCDRPAVCLERREAGPGAVLCGPGHHQRSVLERSGRQRRARTERESAGSVPQSRSGIQPQPAHHAQLWLFAISNRAAHGGRSHRSRPSGHGDDRLQHGLRHVGLCLLGCRGDLGRTEPDSLFPRRHQRRGRPGGCVRP